jgi:hypothetical protein
MEHAFARPMSRLMKTILFAGAAVWLMRRRKSEPVRPSVLEGTADDRPIETPTDALDPRMGVEPRGITIP